MSLPIIQHRFDSPGVNAGAKQFDGINAAQERPMNFAYLASVKERIEAGDYDDDAKLNAAVDEMQRREFARDESVADITAAPDDIDGHDGNAIVGLGVVLGLYAIAFVVAVWMKV